MCRGQAFGLLSHLVKLIKDGRHPAMAPHSCPNTGTDSLALTVILHSLQSLQLTEAQIFKPFIPESLREIIPRPSLAVKPYIIQLFLLVKSSLCNTVKKFEVSKVCC